MKDVAVVIPVWNRRDLLVRVIERLRAQTHPIAEILVVDNGSTDGAPEAAEQHGARVLRMGTNAGFSRAVNRGIEACNSSLIALLNNDVEPEPEWLARLVEALAEPDVWFATGKLLSAADPRLIDGAFDALCRGGCACRVGHGRLDGPLFSRPRRIRLAPATAAVFRAELFRKVGNFDTMFESYLEDVDFGLRCAVAGLEGAYVPEAVARHWGSATLGAWHPNTVRLLAQNQLLLVAKHYPASLLLRWCWPILVAHGLWALVATRHGAPWAYLRGKAAGLFLAADIRRSSTRAPAPQLSRILREGEFQILEFQRASGFDWFWRLYFLLAPGANLLAPGGN